jgi:hypothetical protein
MAKPQAVTNGDFNVSVNRRSGAAAFHLTRVTGARRSGSYAASFREMVVA